MKLEFLLAAVAVAPATLARSWGGRGDDVAELDVEDLQPVVEKWTTYTTVYTTHGVADTTLLSVSTVVFVEHLYTTPGISTWENFTPDSFTSTSTTFTTTTVTHIPHIIYKTSSWPDAQAIALAKRSTVSITDWVTVTREPDNPEGTSTITSSSETTTSTSTPLDAPQTPPFSATATATPTSSLSSSTAPKPFNSSTSASESPSSTSAVSGAPPITSPPSSEASTPTSTSSSESSPSTSLAAPPAPVTPTAPIDSTSLTVPAGPPSSSDLLPTTNRRPHPSTLWTLTSGFKPPVSSTVTFVIPSHEGTHLSMALGPSSNENDPPEALAPSGDTPPSVNDEVPPSVTAPFTLTIVAPPESLSMVPTTPPTTSSTTLTDPPASSSIVRCDDAWCSSDGTSYCMRWDGASSTNTFGIVTPGEIFTTVGLCTRTVYVASQEPTVAGDATAPAITRI